MEKLRKTLNKSSLIHFQAHRRKNSKFDAKSNVFLLKHHKILDYLFEKAQNRSNFAKPNKKIPFVKPLSKDYILPKPVLSRLQIPTYRIPTHRHVSLNDNKMLFRLCQTRVHSTQSS